MCKLTKHSKKSYNNNILITMMMIVDFTQIYLQNCAAEFTITSPIYERRILVFSINKNEYILLVTRWTLMKNCWLTDFADCVSCETNENHFHRYAVSRGRCSHSFLVYSSCGKIFFSRILPTNTIELVWIDEISELHDWPVYLMKLKTNSNVD